VDGPSLRDLIEKKFAASIDVDTDDVAESLFYMSQLCDALYATHKEGIIHRDIKPDNILINSEGVVKVTDFGIVHVEEATFTPTGAMVGTPRYMSPEQIQGKRLDGRSDIYAAGIILYELMTGSPPFITGDISYQHVNMPPTPPRDICPVIPEGVNHIILKCLAKSTDERYPDAMLLKIDIDRELEEINRERSLTHDTNVFDTGIGSGTNAALDF
jgi:serine/threonine-protein kinase